MNLGAKWMKGLIPFIWLFNFCGLSLIGGLIELCTCFLQPAQLKTRFVLFGVAFFTLTGAMDFLIRDSGKRIVFCFLPITMFHYWS